MQQLVNCTLARKAPGQFGKRRQCCYQQVFICTPFARDDINQKRTLNGSGQTAPCNGVGMLHPRMNHHAPPLWQ